MLKLLLNIVKSRWRPKLISRLLKTTNIDLATKFFTKYLKQCKRVTEKANPLNGEVILGKLV